MNKIAVVVLADTETAEDTGRVVNAMQTVKEFKEGENEAVLIFDGAGTKWIREFSRSGHQYKDLYEDVKENISGVCKYCSQAFGVNESAEDEDLRLLDEFEEHPSFKKLISQGYQVITF